MSKLNLLSASLPSYTMTLPVSGQTVTFRPFIVKEEKVLLIALQSKNSKQISDSIRNVVMSCTNSVLDTQKIGVAEAEFAFLQIRAKSIGEEVKPQVKCSNCGEETTIKIHLDSIEMKKKETESIDPVIHISDDLSITMRYPSIHDTDPNKGEIEVAFSLAEQCIESFILKDEVLTKKDINAKEITEFIDNLLPDQFLKILNFVKSAPELEYKFGYKCPKCGERVQVTLTTISDFFQ
jgi:DNA-directed RNA polymerase subunit RPC12/RpoP